MLYFILIVLLTLDCNEQTSQLAHLHWANVCKTIVNISCFSNAKPTLIQCHMFNDEINTNGTKNYWKIYIGPTYVFKSQKVNCFYDVNPTLIRCISIDFDSTNAQWSIYGKKLIKIILWLLTIR